ncbi:ubiquitin carboxyl-terminal hydrolase 35-like isoform X2 [Odontomachus brunneus]|uniref:ubiquitin carboxyl-terminal hydrolase 35-like isoform X2 n=1 Tax=Odontomachus brunneus TaxID=486640 RepID=UPI0013F1AD7F|nr:ubiquitin carboxyl-terminal hydrolase 35-like isoform X2 [Odontomachus brunneus]
MGVILNISEVPKIMAWILPHVEEKSDSDNADPISKDVAALLQKTDIRDMSHLAALLKTMLDNRVYLPKSADHTALCEAVIVRLSSFQLPPEPKKILEFYENATKIQNFLETVCKNAKNSGHDLLFICLQTLYRIISDRKRKQEPGPGLAAILRLVETSFIPQAVEWILSQSQSNHELVQALTVLCNWLPKWRDKRLSLWIMEFIYGLEKQEKFSVLLEVTESSLDILNLMGKVLVVPVIRHNSSFIIYHILKKLSSEEIIQKLIKTVPTLINSLMKEDSESSRECIQYLVDIVKLASLRFPAYRLPESVEKSFPVSPRMHVIKDFYREPLWVAETCTIEPILEPEVQLSGKVGLQNLGNTCYMNSVLQALLMTRQFCYEVLNCLVNQTGGMPLLRKLQDLFALLLYSKRMYLSPNEIFEASRPSYFLPGQQQDSSEFLCHLLDVLHEQEKAINTTCGRNDSISGTKCKTEMQEKGTPSTNSTEGTIKRWITEEDLTEGLVFRRKTQSLADFPQGEDLIQAERLSDYHSDSTDSGIQSVGGEETVSSTSLVHRVLGGESKITYQCAQCNTSSHNTDKFRDLQLCFPEEIQENQEVSVQDLINYYLAPEKLTGENKYRCDKCMKLCDAHRIITILQAPAHLILSLKHFRYDFDSRLRTKLRHKVLYNDVIKLPVSAVPNSIAETYHLYAAVVHSGYNMDYGHYFTYACGSKQNWYKFNDSFVSRTTFEEFKNLKPPDTPYILFYEKSGALDGMYEDDRPELSTLSKHLQELIADDTTAYIEELKQQATLSLSGRHSRSVRKRYDNSDDENPPSSSCRGAIDIPANRFLY